MSNLEIFRLDILFVLLSFQVLRFSLLYGVDFKTIFNQKIWKARSFLLCWHMWFLCVWIMSLLIKWCGGIAYRKNFFSCIFNAKKRNWKTFFHNDTQFFYFVHKCLIKKKISSRLFFWQTCAIYYICYTPFRTKTVHMWRSTNVWKSGKNEKKQITANFVYFSFQFSCSRENFAFPINTSSNRLFGLINIFCPPNSLFSFLPHPRSDWTFRGR